MEIEYDMHVTLLVAHLLACSLAKNRIRHRWEYVHWKCKWSSDCCMMGFLFSLCRGVQMILIGFKFHPGHQNAKYVCGDVNKGEKKKGGHQYYWHCWIYIRAIGLFLTHLLFFICLILELYINVCSIRILKQCIPHLLSVLILVYVFPR